MVRNETITLSEPQLRDMLEEAAEAGAKKALRAVGLHDDDAPGDVHDLRGLLEAWRSTKKAALSTAVKVLTTALLSAIIAALGLAAWSSKN